MKKKLLSLAVCMSMSVALLAGCGGSKDEGTTTTPTPQTSEAPAGETSSTPSTESTSQTSGTKEITYWSMWSNTEPQAAVIEEAAQKYEADTGIHVNIEWKGRDIRQLIGPAIQGGEKIDLFDDDYQRIAQDHSNFVLDLTEMVNAAGYESHGREILLDTQKGWADGKLLGIPYQPYTSGIFYDKDLFEQAGIEKAPETWGEFLDVCQKLVDADIQPLALDDAYAKLNLGYQLARYIGQDAVKTLVQEKDWDNESLLKAVKDLQELKDKGYLAKSAPAAYPKGENEIGFGKTAMVVNASWVPNEIQNNTKSEINWGYFPYPAVEGGVDGTEAAMIGAQGFGINSSSENAQAAFDFIMMLTTGEFDKKLADATNTIPADKENTEWPPLVAMCKDSFEGLTKHYDWNCGIDDNPDAMTVINDNILKVYEGKLTAEDFVAAMKKAIK